MPEPKTVRLASGDGEAEIALRGAEPLIWRVRGRDLLWSGDPAHWSFRAPLLFPVVGASRDGQIRVAGRAYPMPQHGFARTAEFGVVEQDADRVRLRLEDDEATRAAYPFSFRLDVEVSLSDATLAVSCAVTNIGPEPMPYGLGFHPAFPWPLDGAARAGHRVVFGEPEAPSVPEVAPGGLLARGTRAVPLDGRVLPLDPALFTEALVFLDSRSRAMAFEAPSGAAIVLEAEGCRHLAVWSRPDAPFLSLEAWTGHADWEDASGDLETRASILMLAAGETGRHAIRLEYRAVA